MEGRSNSFCPVSAEAKSCLQLSTPVQHCLQSPCIELWPIVNVDTALRVGDTEGD